MSTTTNALTTPGYGQFQAPKKPDRADSGFLLARTIFDAALRHHLAGSIEGAINGYEHALFLEPDYVEAHNNLGVALASQGKANAAIARYVRAISLRPDYAEAHNNLGVALAAQGSIERAIAHYRRVLTINPQHFGAHNNLGLALATQNRFAEAAVYYTYAVALKPDYADAHNNLANALAALGRTGDAMAHYQRALALNPNHAEAHNNLANAFREQGRFDQALLHYERAIAIQPHNPAAHFHRAEIRTFRPGDPELTALEALARRKDMAAGSAPFVHFALAKALEDTGDHGRAFAHLQKGNDWKRSQIHYDEPSVATRFHRIAAVFDKTFLELPGGAGNPSPGPIFVVGMPRSGSTLVEQILASHPQIHGAGELTNLEKAANAVSGSANFPENVLHLDRPALRRIGEVYLAGLPPLANGKLRIVDKLPDNFIRIGLIHLILPGAKIVHTMRNPIDTCLSCYSKLFTSGQHFSYDLGELGRYYRHYEALMSHWRSVLPRGAVLDVVYEEVVEDLETQARRLIAYCGLPWDDSCLSFHKTARPIKTASAVQVRKPLYRSSLQRWRKYGAELGPLLRELAAENFHHVRSADAA